MGNLFMYPYDELGCKCQACLDEKIPPEKYLGGRIFMILCPDCGNKRCPQASNHIYKCSGSNEPNQIKVPKC